MTGTLPSTTTPASLSQSRGPRDHTIEESPLPPPPYERQGGQEDQNDNEEERRIQRLREVMDSMLRA